MGGLETDILYNCYRYILSRFIEIILDNREIVIWIYGRTRDGHFYRDYFGFILFW